LIEEIVHLASGHNVVATVYVDCRSMYRADGPEAFRPVGEVEFANGVAAMAASGGYGKTAMCAGIVSHVNLLIGDPGQGGARGGDCCRQRPVPRHPPLLGLGRGSQCGLTCMRTGRRAFCSIPLSARVLPAWGRSAQLRRLAVPPADRELTDLARAFPRPGSWLDHCGGPVGTGRFAGKRAETFPVWKASIQEIAKCENVAVKLGGWRCASRLRLPPPPRSRRRRRNWLPSAPYVETCIEAFGPSRCMFESNFPPDKGNAAIR